MECTGARRKGDNVFFTMRPCMSYMTYMMYNLTTEVVLREMAVCHKRPSAALLSESGLGYILMYASGGLILSALYLTYSYTPKGVVQK